MWVKTMDRRPDGDSSDGVVIRSVRRASNW
jgi:hypothetical protein